MIFNLFSTKIHSLLEDKRFAEIFTGSFWALSANVVTACLSMVTSIIVARVYGADILGIVAVLASFLQFAAIFTVLGTNTSILRLIPEHLAKFSPASAFLVYRKTQYFVMCVSVITGTLLFFASGFIAETVFSKPHFSFYFSMAALFIVFISLMQLNTQAVRGLRLIRMFAFMRLLPSLCGLIVLVPITVFFFHKDNPVVAMLVSFVVTAIFGAVVMNRAFKKRIKTEDIVNPISLKKILAISLPMLMTTTMSFVIGQTGVIMLGMFRSEAEVGYYSVAVKLATLTTFVLSAVNSMAAPKFSELYQRDKLEELLYVAKKSSKLIFWMTTPILLFLIFFGKYLLSLLYGPDFSIAYWAMFFLVLGQFLNSVSGSTGYFMNMTGGQKVFRNVMFMAAILNIIINLLLIPVFGICGAALAGMSSIVFWNVYLLIYIKRMYGSTTGYLPLVG